MIQASQLKQIEPKAAQSVDGKTKANQASKGSAESLEAQLFANELEASLATGVEVKPVVMTAEQMLELPSKLVDPSAMNTGAVETTSPKIFDPDLTEGVEKLIGPRAEVAPTVINGQEVVLDADGLPVELQAQTAKAEMKSEIAQALLKTPQVPEVATGRAPAIEFTQTEIDPQLLNMDDFVAQKNLATKKSIQGQAYGMNKPQQQQQVALENGLTQTQVINESPASESAGQSVNSQQFILNMMSEQKSAPQVNETHAAPKVFDMSQVKSSNADQVMTQITDYIVQAKAAKEPTVNMRVNHEELGMIDITVTKSGLNREAVAIQIGAHTIEGKSFFQQNSKELFTHMSQAGISVSDLKVETPNQTAKNDFDFGQQNGRNAQGDKQFGSEQNQRRHESDRRQDLWKLLNQEAA